MLTCCLLLAAVPSCTHLSAVPDGAALQGPEAAGGLQDALAGIPFPADDTAGRSPAALIPLTIPGNAEYWRSDGSYDEDTHHVLPAALDALEWAIYRLPTDGNPALSVGRSAAADRRHLFRYRQFHQGSWEFGYPLTTSHYSRGLNANLISPSGRVYIAIATFNVSTARVVSASIVLDQPAGCIPSWPA
jgi:hypothetical protein